MVKPKRTTYLPSDWGKEEEKMMQKYELQIKEAKDWFLSEIKPVLDRSYKLYMSDNSDRAKEIQSWQANVFIPYINAVVETLMPRILDARPEFSVQGRTQDDQPSAEKLQGLIAFTWEISQMDTVSEDLVRSALIYGNAFLQVGWKKSEEEKLFLVTKDFNSKKPAWKKEKRVKYDAPFAACVDNYALWYDHRNIPRASKQYWFKRSVMTGEEIKQTYPYHDKARLDLALHSSDKELKDYAAVRYEIKKKHTKVGKNADAGASGGRSDTYENVGDPDLEMHEVFEWTRPFDDAFAVMVNKVPILKGGSIPIPYDFKEAPFINIPYLRLPHEFEGVGVPVLLESPQNMLNMIKNQRLDAVSMSIHKMWVVSPAANVDNSQLVVRPFGIIYSVDPQGVREVQFSDINASAYREEELLKSDLKYASGVDDFSMANGGGAGSATEIRHLRESTLERVRLFVNHLGDGYSTMMRMWIDMYRQFFTAELTARITGEDGRKVFLPIEKGDLMGYYDFVASVIPSIAGKNDVDKKQGMDLFQLLSPLEFIDAEKLTGKILQSWNWNLDSLKRQEDPMQASPQIDPATGLPMGGAMPGMDGSMPPEGMSMEGETPIGPPDIGSGAIPADVIQKAVALLDKTGVPAAEANSAFREASMPINLMGGSPPTAPSVPTNVAGFNRKGKVNTNIPVNAPSGEGAQLLTRAQSVNG